MLRSPTVRLLLAIVLLAILIVLAVRLVGPPTADDVDDAPTASREGGSVTPAPEGGGDREPEGPSGTGPSAPEGEAERESLVTLHGRVTERGSGAPVGRPHVALHHARAGELRSAPDGTYVLEGFPRRGGFVIVAAAGFVPTFGQIAPDPRGGDIEADFQLVRGARLTGRVVDPDGSPIEGAVVGSDASSLHLRFPGTAVTDAEGRFSITVAPGPKVGVAAWKLDHVRGHKPVGVVEAGRTVDVGDVVLGPGGSISGRVTLGGGSRPGDVSIVVKSLVGGVPSLPATPDATGVYTVTGVSPGLCRVVASCPGFLDASREPVEVAVGETVRGIDLAISRGPSIAGRVEDERGRPVAGVKLAIWGAEEETRSVHSSARSDREGRFEVGGLAEGRYTVFVFGGRDEGTSTESRYRVATGATDVSFRISRGARLLGRVRFADDRAPAFAYTLHLHERSTARSRQWEERIVSADGAFEIDRLAPGTYGVYARTSTGEVTRAAPGIELAEGEMSATIELDLVEGRPLRGRVTDEEGSRPEHVYVHVRLEGVAVFRMCRIPHVDAAGRFVTEPLPPGEYAIHASGPGLEQSGQIRGSLDDLVVNPVEIRLARKR